MQPSDLDIRNAGHSDLPALLSLYQHLSGSEYRLSNSDASQILDRFLTYTGSAIFLGETGDQLAASCVLVVVPNLTRGGRPYGLIENVVTHPEFRCRGFGKRMLDAACDTAWGHGCYKVMLLTGSKQGETLKFYKSAGFEQSKTGFQKRNLPIRDES